MLRAGRSDIGQERAASQHPGDGLKPSLEITPPGATPIHSGCPLGERPYGSEDAQKGVSPQSPGSRAVLNAHRRDDALTVSRNQKARAADVLQLEGARTKW